MNASFNPQRIHSGALLFFGAISTLSASSVDRAAAERAVQASLTLHPGSDIMSDYEGRDIRVVDLDGDGVDEILFHLTATCIGANFDCTNELVVLTALKPGDKRAVSQAPELSPQWDADLAAVRKSGYADDAAIQIPGEVEQISVSGNRVHVTFDVKLDSPICDRFVYIDGERKPTTHCPAPGRYHWVYAWTPGKLARVASPR